MLGNDRLLASALGGGVAGPTVHSGDERRGSTAHRRGRHGRGRAADVSSAVPARTCTPARWGSCRRTRSSAGRTGRWRAGRTCSPEAQVELSQALVHAPPGKSALLTQVSPEEQLHALSRARVVGGSGAGRQHPRSEAERTARGTRTAAEPISQPRGPRWEMSGGRLPKVDRGSMPLARRLPSRPAWLHRLAIPSRGVRASGSADLIEAGQCGWRPVGGGATWRHAARASARTGATPDGGCPPRPRCVDIPHPGAKGLCPSASGEEAPGPLVGEEQLHFPCALRICSHLRRAEVAGLFPGGDGGGPLRRRLEPLGGVDAGEPAHPHSGQGQPPPPGPGTGCRERPRRRRASRAAVSSPRCSPDEGEADATSGRLRWRSRRTLRAWSRLAALRRWSSAVTKRLRRRPPPGPGRCLAPGLARACRASAPPGGSARGCHPRPR